MGTGKNFYSKVYDAVRQIPRGRVATYQQVAIAVSTPRAAQAVGWALRALPTGSDVPWQRVINSRGMISTTCREHPASLQVALLRKEGIAVIMRRDGSGWVDLKKYLWQSYIVNSKL